MSEDPRLIPRAAVSRMLRAMADAIDSGAANPQKIQLQKSDSDERVLVTTVLFGTFAGAEFRQPAPKRSPGSVNGG